MQKDNTTFKQKLGLRKQALSWLQHPLHVVETHGGWGRLFPYLYDEAVEGLVFETDKEKLFALSQQRPAWKVYGCASEKGIAYGFSTDQPTTVLDVDPYGSPWEVLEAWFGKERSHAPDLVVVVNDGMRQKIQITGGWGVSVLHDYLPLFGQSRMYKDYLLVCRQKLSDLASPVGYSIDQWIGYHCGANKGMTHYAALLTQRSEGSISCA